MSRTALLLLLLLFALARYGNPDATRFVVRPGIAMALDPGQLTPEAKAVLNDELAFHKDLILKRRSPAIHLVVFGKQQCKFPLTINRTTHSLSGA